MLKMMLVLGLCLTVNFSGEALLWAEGGISINPPVVETIVKPGKTVTGYFKVTNPTDKTIVVEVQPEKWDRFVPIKEYAISTWLETKKTKTFINPGKTKEIKYRIKMPKDAKGELMAMVFFSFSAQDESKATQVAVGQRFGAAVYAAASGTEILDASVEKVRISRTEKDKKNGLMFNCEIKNKSNIHIRPWGNVIVRDEKDNTLGSTIAEHGRPIYPDNSFTYGAFWENEGLAPGKYKALVIFNYGDIYRSPLVQYSKTVPFEINASSEVVVENAPN